MKICAACCNELPQSSFSKKQWKLKQYERRCTDCIAANRDLQLKPPPKTDAKKEDAPTCYICLDDGPDELGGEVMRDCSCRGGSGYVHLSCAVNYAEQKYINSAGKKLEEDPFKTCPNCHQYYMNDLSIDMAKKYIDFVQKTYPHNHTLILSAHVGRLESLTTKIQSRSPSQTKEAEQVANSILHKVREMKLKRIPVTHSDHVYEAYAYEILGCMTWEDSDGDKGKLQEVLGYLEKSLDVSKANKFPNGCIRVRGFIEDVKSEINECDSEESLVCQKQIYEQTSKEFGETSQNAIQTGLKYASTLKRLHQGVKSELLVYKLNDISYRNHGPDHRITKLTLSRKSKYMCRAVSISSKKSSDEISQALSYNDYDVGGTYYQFLKYDRNFDRCIVIGPMRMGSSNDDSKELSLSINDVVFALGTPVIRETASLDNKELGEIRSWDHDTKCYTVHWVDESVEEVHRSKVWVPKCICDKCMRVGGNPFI